MQSAAIFFFLDFFRIFLSSHLFKNGIFSLLNTCNNDKLHKIKINLKIFCRPYFKVEIVSFGLQ